MENNNSLANKLTQEMEEKKVQQEQDVYNAEIVRRREKSLAKYPDVSLDNDEYVVVSVKRHYIGYVGTLIISLFLFIVLTSLWILLSFVRTKIVLPENIKANLSIFFLPIIALLLVLSYVNYTVYKANKLIITNERALQWIVSGILNTKKQVINLESIEDISFTQVGVMQHLFNYGTIKLSTVGDESTYTFNFAPDPSKKAELLGDIVEACKKKEPISEELLSLGEKMSI